MSKIKYQVQYSISEVALQNIELKDVDQYLQSQLQRKICEKIVKERPIKKMKNFEELSYFVDFCLATEEEFWREVIKEAKILRKHLDKQEDEQIAIDYLQKMTSSTEV